MSNSTPVRLSTLVPDRCNFADGVFKHYVQAWMDRNMLGVPIGLLDTSSTDRWEIHPNRYHEVEFIRSESEESEEGEAKAVSGWALQNLATGAWADDLTYSCIEPCADALVEYADTDYVLVWDDRAEAEAAARFCDREFDCEQGHEYRFGFPWAHTWCFLPEECIETDDLLKAGFVVALYVGGGGNLYRVCGIDGGGYSFVGSHYALLVALHSERHELTVETATGYRHITVDERSTLEKLADLT